MRIIENQSYETDVLVCGGGTSGIAAAWGAAKSGCSVIIIDENDCIGGTPVNSLVNIMAYGAHDKKRWIIGGFFKEFRRRMIDAGYMIETERKGWEPFNIEGYVKTIYSMMKEVNVKIMCDMKAVKVFKEKDIIRSVECVSCDGQKTLFQAKAFIDTTGNGAIGIMSDCEYYYGHPETGVSQAYTLYYQLGNVDIEKAGKYLSKSGQKGFWEKADGSNYLNLTGLRKEVAEARKSGLIKIARDHVANISSVPGLDGVVSVNYGRINPDKKSICEIYIEGIEQAHEGLDFLKKKIPGFEKTQLIRLAPKVGIRDGHRIKGKYLVTREDIINLRQFDDAIAQGCYMIDIHIPDSDETKHFRLDPGTHYDIPMGAIISKDYANLFMAGKCISADFESLAAIRVQPIAMATGHAAGVAAAVLALKGKTDYSLVNKYLLEQGAILR